MCEYYCPSCEVNTDAYKWSKNPNGTIWRFCNRCGIHIVTLPPKPIHIREFGVEIPWDEVDK